ncbi:hypothetical protein PT974_03948 [Cladobotryum mycophilum]|uniref:DASH complex subunit SPC34 n=1 Tax=Cladobotryum mycophilum TaxID=491253 RepID=A0ABR0SU38_9HYPO
MTRRTRNARRQSSSTANLKLSPAQMSVLQSAVINPASPPETPTESSLLPRKNNQSPFYLFANSLAQDPNIRPYGNGHQFSYRPLEQLSPRSSSSSSSSEAVKESTDDASSESASIVSLPNSPPQPQHTPTTVEASIEASQSEQSDADSESDSDADSEAESEAESESASASEADSEAESEKPAQANSVHTQATSTTEACDFTIEDVDPMDSGCEGLDVLFPTEVESNRSRSRSRPRDLDKGMMQDLKNLNCSNEASDNEPEPGFDEDAFLKRQQELKRIRRVSMSSSFGKRTHSELSDSDDNDATLDVNEVGSSARRFRKRLHRGSLLFHDPQSLELMSWRSLIPARTSVQLPASENLHQCTALQPRHYVSNPRHRSPRALSLLRPPPPPPAKPTKTVEKETIKPSNRRQTVFNVASGEVTTGPPTRPGASNPRRHTAVAAVLGGEMHDQLRRGEIDRKGDLDVEVLLRGAEKLCGVYELPGARERITALRSRFRNGKNTTTYYEAKVSEQADQLASMNKDWMDQDEDEGEEGEGAANEGGGDEWTEEDLRREEEEARQMEAKKRELQARLRSMEKDLGGLRYR